MGFTRLRIVGASVFCLLWLLHVSSSQAGHIFAERAIRSAGSGALLARPSVVFGLAGPAVATRLNSPVDAPRPLNGATGGGELTSGSATIAPPPGDLTIDAARKWSYPAFVEVLKIAFPPSGGAASASIAAEPTLLADSAAGLPRTNLSAWREPAQMSAPPVGSDIPVLVSIRAPAREPSKWTPLGLETLAL